MNRCLLFLLLGFIGYSFQLSAQSNYILVDVPSTKLTTVKLDTTIYVPQTNGGALLKIDLDKNGITDLTFGVFTYGGASSGARMGSNVSTGDSTLIDTTLGIKKLVFKYPDSIFYTKATIPRILNSNDTLFADSCGATHSSIYYIESNPQLNPVIYITEWGKGIHFLGFKKIKNNKVYLGWVKMEASSAIKFYEYAIQALPVGIHETEEPHILTYPNPTHTGVTIEGTQCKKIELYDVLGKLVLTKEINSSQPSFYVDIENIIPGMYFLKLFAKDSNQFVTRKILKE